MVDFEKTDVSQDFNLEFKPLTEGLGFQPFSDGLPYAPLSKSSRGVSLSTTGAGATVAGPHRYSIPKGNKQANSISKSEAQGPERQALSPLATHSLASSQSRHSPHIPSVDVPIVSLSSHPQTLRHGTLHQGSVSPQIRSTDSAPLSSTAESTLLSQHAALSANPNPLSTSEINTEALPEHYLGKRVLAYFIDLGFNSLLMGTVLSVTLWFYEVDTQILLHSSMLALSLLVLVSMSWVLVLLQEIVFKTSLGKYFFRLMLSGGRGQILLRGLFFPLSLAPLGLGLLWALLDRNKACLHDRLLGSQPLEMKNFH